MAGPRRGFIRREVTELDLKGYMAGRAQPGLDPAAGFSKKYTAPALWAVPGPGGPRERAMSPARLRAGARELEAEAGRERLEWSWKVYRCNYRCDEAGHCK